MWCFGRCEAQIVGNEDVCRYVELVALTREWPLVVVIGKCGLGAAAGRGDEERDWEAMGMICCCYECFMYY